MFLLTMVLILISMLGVYTQVYALEAARFLASQTSLAQTLLNWHTTAASVASNVVSPSSFSGTGCSLTPNTSNMCPIGAGYTNIGTTSAAVVTGLFRNNTSGMIFPNTPPNSGTNIFVWNSVGFMPPTGGFYVVTYVTPPTNPAGFVSTATASPTKLNVSLSDIYRQLHLLGIPYYSFGYIQNGVLTASPIAIDVGGVSTLRAMNYSVPLSIPTGSLGIISSPGQCSTC